MPDRLDHEHLARLRAYLEALISDEVATRPTDPARADHLRDAIADSRTLIARLEGALSDDRREPPRQPERSRAGHIGDDPSTLPPKWNALSHLSVAVGAA